MAKICKCHQKTKEAIAQGMSFEDANRKFGKSGYHEHRCECSCGCKNDTQGYGYCPYCHFSKDCLKLRGETLGILAIPFKLE